ncbi:MAG: diaminopimelate dehydrogenase [Oscillospiraceae bacterium]|nr:diaminopimelate dehydrogenase [Oscillospiraceae bacterium]
MYRAAIIGLGNVGRFAVEALSAAPDFELAGVVRRNPLSANSGGMAEKRCGVPEDVIVTDDIERLGHIDVALLCTPTRSCEQYAIKYLKMGINTVDSYDEHSLVYDLKMNLDGAAKEHGAVAIISAGWDPGTDSVVRALMSACAPKGVTYTNFGPGVSMGHTVAAKAISGVRAALSMTLPLGAGLHRRVVYVELDDGADFNKVRADIIADSYFSADETHIIRVESVDDVSNMGHGVNMVRYGVSGATHNQRFEFNMMINNPALTSQIMVAYARASMRAKPGAYTTIEIPPIDLLYGEREKLIRALV